MKVLLDIACAHGLSDTEDTYGRRDDNDNARLRYGTATPTREVPTNSFSSRFSATETPVSRDKSIGMRSENSFHG